MRFESGIPKKGLLKLELPSSVIAATNNVYWRLYQNPLSTTWTGATISSSSSTHIYVLFG